MHQRPWCVILCPVCGQSRKEALQITRSWVAQLSHCKCSDNPCSLCLNHAFFKKMLKKLKGDPDLQRQPDMLLSSLMLIRSENSPLHGGD